MAALLLSGSVGHYGCRHSLTGPKLRIGYQKWGTFSILKASGILAEKLEDQHIEIQWYEFSAGPPLLEALNTGNLDIGHTGDSPPIFAQAADMPFRYFAMSPPSPQSSAIVVPHDSKIADGKELRGKRVGYTKGTSAHTMVLRYLENQGLRLQDIQTCYLPPAEGRLALETGAIDAWSTWDPYLAAAEHNKSIRKLADGTGIVEGREFYLCSWDLLQRSPEMLSQISQVLQYVKHWVRTHQNEVNRFLAEQTGLSPEVIALAENRRVRYDALPLTSEVVASQQDLADRYHELKLIPVPINVEQAIYRSPLPNLQVKT